MTVADKEQGEPPAARGRRWWPVLLGLASVAVLAYTMLAIFWLPKWIVSQVAPPGVPPGDQLKAINDVRSGLLSVLTPVVAVLAGIAAVLSFRETRRQNKRMFEITKDQLKTTQRQLDLNLQDQVNERFNRAIGQLGSENLDVRVGAIYALEQIGRDTPADQPGDLYWPTVGTLTAFIREHTKTDEAAPQCGNQPEPNMDGASSRIAEDIQTALNVLGRRDWKRDRYKLNLRQTNLDGAHFSEAANFDGAHFDGASLRRADLTGVRLVGATFPQADLRRAKLIRANLYDAALRGANLQDADLGYANLEGAYLEDANLQGAMLSGANLKEANLQEAKLERALLRRTNLQDANLDRADFEEADLMGANLQSARLGLSNLRGANLCGADLQDAYLSDAKLHGAHLTDLEQLEAKGLTWNQLNLAQGANEAILPEYLLRPSRSGPGPVGS